jgi:hypothetical protein
MQEAYNLEVSFEELHQLAKAALVEHPMGSSCDYLAQRMHMLTTDELLVIRTGMETVGLVRHDMAGLLIPVSPEAVYAQARIILRVRGEACHKPGTTTHCRLCHTCGSPLRQVLDGEEWCDACGCYRRYVSHGFVHVMNEAYYGVTSSSGGQYCPW